MADFVIQHALQNVWCTPNQDRTVIIPPVKISQADGSFLSLQVLWEVIELPDRKNFFYVYQIGQVPADLFNLPLTQNTWLNAGRIAESQNMIIRVYGENGITFPLAETWFRVNRDRNLIVAVRKIKNWAVDFTTQQLHLSLYSNSYFNSARWQSARVAAGKPNAPAIKYFAAEIINGSEIGNFRSKVTNAFNASVNTPIVMYSKNGRFHTDLSQATDIAIGDYVEAIIDSSIREVRVVTPAHFQPFTSILDAGQTKRLFPPTRSGLTIDYKDDVEFFMVASNTGSLLKRGLFFNQDSENCVRMVTHNSWALSDLQIQNLISNDTRFHSEADIQIAAIIRHAGYKRTLLDDHHRILDMYRMSDDDIEQALLGVDSSLPEWRADNLENSEYSKLMGYTQDQITATLVENAYGYNLLTKLFANAYPTVVVSSNVDKQFPSPLGIDQLVMTTYTFDGKLVATGNGIPGALQTLPLPSVNAVSVELTPGRIYPSNDSSRWLGTPTITLTKTFASLGYRCYVCPISGGNPTNAWIDVTSNVDNYFSITNNGKTLTWDMAALSVAQYYPAVVVGDEVIWNLIPLDDDYPGYVRFSIASKQWVSAVWPASDGVPPSLTTIPVTIPTGALDIFMNGESLVEGIDYFVNWPEVVVVKRPTNTPLTGLKVYARAYGFCKTDVTREGPREVGFVQGGVMSTDGYFRVRNDHNIRVVLGGSMLIPETRVFSEDGSPIVPLSPLNGKPYSVTDIVMPVLNWTSKETVAFREIAADVDNRVSDYLTLRIGGTAAPAVNPLAGSKYDLYSPFFSALLHNFMNTNWLGNGELDAPYDNVDVAGWVAQWTFLLDYDPCLKADLDMRYLYIRPHQYDTPVVVTAKQFAFLEYIVINYLTLPAQAPRLNLSAYINISG